MGLLSAILFGLSQASSAAILNVKDYGANGDGSADDTAAIQSAINTTVYGDTVTVPDGIYMTQILR